MLEPEKLAPLQGGAHSRNIPRPLAKDMIASILENHVECVFLALHSCVLVSSRPRLAASEKL